MISQDSIKQISHLFCGDIEGYYSYKSGPQLVAFFNQYFNASDKYGAGFPSRWSYVFDKIVAMFSNNTIDSFITTILDKQYIMKDLNIPMVEAAEKSEILYDELNSIVKRDFFSIIHVNGYYHLIQDNEDLVFIDSGGFAKVYYQKSTGLIVKKLKDDYLTDRGIRSRFKREFTITKSLQDAYGIIRVFSFDENECSYTMERAEITLEDYIKNNELSDDIKVTCIRQILLIMTEVHKRGIIHRDISPNNIFIISGRLKLADFGLGKDLNVFASHQTIQTNAVGQYLYCAPEQFMLLKDADKRSDVYSLGRVINFIMTRNPADFHHIYGTVTNKAACPDAAFRFADAEQLSQYFEKSIQYHLNKENKERIEQLIQERSYNSDVENYIYELDSESICKYILNRKTGFFDALITFMRASDERAQHIIHCVENSYHAICDSSFAAYDPFASFSYRVIKSDFSFVVKEMAAMILRYVAHDINRFSAQHLVDDLISEGIDPLLEDILKP